MNRSCYLAGPISGLTYDQAIQWRAHAARELARWGIVAYSPLRWKSYLATTGTINPVGQYTNPLSTPAGIVTRDRMDCTRSGVVLVNLLAATRGALGSCIEMGWADAARVPIVLVMENEGNPNDHDMVNQLAGFRVTTLAQAVKLVVALLVPDLDPSDVA